MYQPRLNSHEGKAIAHREVPAKGSTQQRSASKRTQPPSAIPTGPMVFDGVLYVKWIEGRNGSFAVGELKTALGDFKIKDSFLDQFEEGFYSGRFWISTIYPASWSASGRITIEVRATVVDVQIAEESKEKSKPATAATDPDPIDETPPPQAPAAPSASTCPAPKAPTARDATCEDRELFGIDLFDLVDRRMVLKLDTTVDRVLLRRQRDRLHALGYEFFSKTQEWLPPQ